jgi:hypothetical protein
MHLVVLGLILLVAIFGPSLWVGAVMRRYSLPRDRYAQSGSEAARALLDAQGLKQIAVEMTDRGDHYDPVAKAVRLSPQNFKDRSLTALTVAAHEVGHAIQDSTGYRPLQLRTGLVRLTHPIQRIGAAALMLSPFVVMLTRAPAIGRLSFIVGLATLAIGIVVHALTLPTELDASFGRALPLIRRHALLRDEDIPRAHTLLTAAALTYVSGALQSLLNIARWWAILRR